MTFKEVEEEYGVTPEEIRAALEFASQLVEVELGRVRLRPA